ncbi:hypothetical protein B0H63DRAFT_506100 [Podospora didyma]|uniref:Bromodomain associated domain-containing protein n=1 Tax=Podospora didyma TaxID=330526 RepID=A0AAE0U802_9PEZI|nr:hypothetical protein B0H63DRAFT_506100 [Podospora didyma]
MTPPASLFHTYLRPSVLQILRAAGYHTAKTAVLDSMTDLAVRYFLNLCLMTAGFAAHNGTADNTGAVVPTIVDVRMALQRAGALLPEKAEEEQDFFGFEDMRGTEAFIAWASGPVNREIKRVALDGNEEAYDYLNALKMKHSQTDDDSKFMGTLLGRPNDHGDVQVEGGPFPSISSWEEQMHKAGSRSPDEVHDDLVNGDRDEDSRPPSSGLSSLGDRSIADELDMGMDLS